MMALNQQMKLCIIKHNTFLQNAPSAITLYEYQSTYQQNTIRLRKLCRYNAYFINYAHAKTTCPWSLFKIPCTYFSNFFMFASSVKVSFALFKIHLSNFSRNDKLLLSSLRGKKERNQGKGDNRSSKHFWHEGELLTSAFTGRLLSPKISKLTKTQI